MEADGGAFVRYDPWATIDSEAFTPWGPLSDSWIRTGGRTIWLAASNSKSMRNTSVARLARKRGSRQKCSPRTFHRDPSSTPANLRRRGIIGSESHILPRSSREPDRARERTGCRRWGGVGDEGLSSRYPSGVEHRDPRAGIPSAGIPWNQRVCNSIPPSTQYHRPPPSALRRGGEVRRGKVWFPISTGSGHHQVRSENDAAPRPPASKCGIGMIGDVAATICRHLCCRISHNARRFV
jgi:hypothetical protein